MYIRSFLYSVVWGPDLLWQKNTADNFILLPRVSFKSCDVWGKYTIYEYQISDTSYLYKQRNAYSPPDIIK